MESNLNSSTENLDLQKYWSILKRRRLPALATFMGIVVLAMVLAITREPEYQAEAKLLIETDKSAKLTGLGNELGEIDVISSDADPLATEAEILYSRPIIEKAIATLDLKDNQGKLLKFRNVVNKLKVEPNDVDIRDYSKIAQIFQRFGTDISLIIHTAAQPSHDWAASDPFSDFSVNANGTLNLLQGTREYCPEAVFIFTSTNKVYAVDVSQVLIIQELNYMAF